jgi:hypothetical protein
MIECHLKMLFSALYCHIYYFAFNKDYFYVECDALKQWL